MNSLRFIQILESYGSEPERWPQDERGPMLAFAARFDDAQTLLKEAQALDTWLNLARAPQPSALLKTRILKRAEPFTPRQASLWQALPLRAVAASLIAGVFIGMSSGFGVNFGMGGNSSYVTTPQGVQIEAALQSGALESTLDETQTYAWLDETFTNEASP